MDSAIFARYGPGTPHVTELLGDRQTGLQSILMKAKAEVTAAKPCISTALQLPKTLLRPQCIHIELWVSVFRTVIYQTLRHRPDGIQRYEQRRWMGQTL